MKAIYDSPLPKPDMLKTEEELRAEVVDLFFGFLSEKFDEWFEENDEFPH